MKTIENTSGKIEVIDRMDGEITERVTASEAARRLAAYHNGGDQSDRRRYQRELESGIEHATGGFIYRLAAKEGDA